MTPNQTKSHPPTPLEKLNMERIRLNNLCTAQEKRVNDNIVYIHDHVGRLLLSTVSSALFPEKKAAQKTKDAAPNAPTQKEHVSLTMADYAAILPKTFPFLWKAVKPFVLSWGMKKVQKSVISFLFKKKTSLTK